MEPGKISAGLRQAHPDKPGCYMCDETIHQGLFFGGAHGLSRELTKNLRTGQFLRRRRRCLRSNGGRELTIRAFGARRRLGGHHDHQRR